MSEIVLVTALRPETRAALAALARPQRLRAGTGVRWEAAAGPHRVHVVQTGIGPEATRRGLAEVDARPDLVISFGFAGGLSDVVAPGDLVLADAVVCDESGRQRYGVDAAVLASAAAALPYDLRARVHRGVLFSSPVVLAAIAAKRAAAERLGAVAVEMEAGAVAAYAVARAVPFLPLRVILDPADLSLEDLPPNLESNWAARARVAVTPGVWPLLIALHRHATVAVATLTRTAAAVLPALDLAAAAAGRTSDA